MKKQTKIFIVPKQRAFLEFALMHFKLNQKQVDTVKSVLILDSYLSGGNYRPILNRIHERFIGKYMGRLK